MQVKLLVIHLFEEKSQGKIEFENILCCKLSKHTTRLQISIPTHNHILDALEVWKSDSGLWGCVWVMTAFVFECNWKQKRICFRWKWINNKIPQDRQNLMFCLRWTEHVSVQRKRQNRSWRQTEKNKRINIEKHWWRYIDKNFSFRLSCTLFCIIPQGEC